MILSYLLMFTIMFSMLACQNVEEVTKIGIISDFVEEVTESYNMVFISAHQDMDTLIKAINMCGPFSYILLQYCHVTEEVISKLGDVYIKDNIPNLYIILGPDKQDEQYVTGVVKEIQGVDYIAKIIVICNRKQNMRMYKKQHLYNTYFLSPDTDLTRYSLYYICQFCNAGKDRMELINMWISQVGFKKNLILTPSFSGSFYGTSLRMGTIQGKLQTLSSFKSYNYILLGKMLNLRWNFKYDPRRLIKNNKPIGLLDDLLSGKIDAIGGGWVTTYQRYKFCDFSATSYYIPKKSIISIEPDKSLQHSAVVSAFTWYAWLLVIGSIPAVGVTLYMLRRAEGVGVVDCIWHATVILCWERPRVRNPSLGVRILLGTYKLMSLLIVTYYMNYYVMTLVTPKYSKPPIDSFEQLWESDMKVLSMGHLRQSFINNFKHVKNIEDRTIQAWLPSSGTHPFSKVNKMMVDSPDDYVLVFNYDYFVTHFIDDLSEPGSRRFYKSKYSLSDAYAVILFSKSFPYKEWFNRKIMLLHAMDIISENERRFIMDTEIKGNKFVKLKTYQAGEQESQLITNFHFIGGYIFLFIGYLIVAATVLALEFLASKVKSLIDKHKKTSKQGIVKSLRSKLTKHKKMKKPRKVIKV